MVSGLDRSRVSVAPRGRLRPPDLIRVVARRRRGQAAAGWLSRQPHAGVASAMAIGSNPHQEVRANRHYFLRHRIAGHSRRTTGLGS
jgi:hypothetical protein